MARRSRLTRYLAVVWDRSAARNLQMEADRDFEKIAKAGSKEFQEAMARGGKDAARLLTRSLQQEYRVRMARARLAMAEGTIDEKAFEREGREAAEAFNRGLTGGIRRLRSQGNTDELALLGLSSRFKRVPDGGAAAGVFGLAGGRMLGSFAAPLAGFLTAGAALHEAQDMIGAADELERSVRRLQGTAKLAGVELGILRDQAEANQTEFKLATPIANDLTGVMARLADRAGDITQSRAALGAWLDLAASGGLTASEAMEALEVTFRGQDEGLNRLGLANPADIYKKWGAGADEASKAQAILNEIIDAGSKVQGEWAGSMELASGKADQTRQRIRDLQAEAGNAIRPFQLFTLELKAGFYEVLGGIAERLSLIAQQWKEGPWADRRAARWEALPDWLTRRRGDGPVVTATVGEISSLGLPGGPANENEALRLRRLNAAPIERPLPPIDEKAEEARRARVAALWQRVDMPRPGGMQTADELQAERAAWFAELGGSLERVDSGTADQRRQMLDELERDMEDRFQRIQDVSAEAAYQMASAFQDAFQMMGEEGIALDNLMEGIGRGMAGSLLSGLAQFAEGKAAENIAAAVEAAAYALGFTSHGNFASASAAWAAAAQHTAAATAWAALAGGAGAGRAGVTGGGGGIPTSTRDAGLDTARAAVLDPAPIIIEVDPFDPGNPVHAKAVGAGMDLNVRLGGVPAWAGARR